MKVKYCVEYTIEKENTSGWKNLDGTPAIDKNSDCEWYYTSEEAHKRINSLLLRTDVTRLSLTKKVVFKG